jgi:hypothetical protein
VEVAHPDGERSEPVRICGDETARQSASSKALAIPPEILTKLASLTVRMDALTARPR